MELGVHSLVWLRIIFKLPQLTISAAIACNLASGMGTIAAVKKANKYVEAGIKTSRDIGKGSGPINHFHSTYTLPFAP